MMNLKTLNLLKKFTDGTANIEDLVKSLLPIEANIKLNLSKLNPDLNALLGLAGIKTGESTEIALKITTVTTNNSKGEAKNWIAFLISEKE